MRIDTLSYFSTSLPGMRDNQSAIARLNEQIASGKAFLAPKDDPLATEKILQLSNRVATRSQYVSNQDRAELALNYEQTVVQEMQKAMTDARGLFSISPANDPSLRNVHAEQLKGIFDHMVGLLNTRDPGGNFIFGGFNTILPGSQQPFQKTLDSVSPATATTYNGTPNPGGTRSIEIESGRYVQVNDNLDAVFQSGTVNDFLQNLNQAIIDLPGTTITQTQIDGYRALIDTAMGNLALVEHRIAGVMGEVRDVRGTTNALLLLEKNALSDIQQVDQAAAIMELQTRQTTLEAASRAYALTSGLSLFNYLG
jgi:flagellar hook-associated protein 3 FlgL